MSDTECANCKNGVNHDDCLFDEQLKVFVCKTCLITAWIEKAMNVPLAKVGVKLGQGEKLRAHFYMQAHKNFKRLKGQSLLLTEDERKVLSAYEQIKNKHPSIEKKFSG